MFRLRRSVYLDNNATTQPSRNVIRRTHHVLKHSYGNPSSLYKVARSSAEVLNDSRRIVAETISARDDEIIFSGSASEVNNCILKSVAEHYYPGKKKIISTPIEHASVMKTLEYLAGRGIQVEFVPVDRYGIVDIDRLSSMVDDDTFLLCIMLANNETGTVQDIARISALARERGVLLMSDCVQALGKVPVNVTELGIDYASFSAHKVHGPKGVGFMYVREGSPISAFIHGGHQESGLRAGTEGIHNIAGLAAACEDVPRMLDRAGEIRMLRDQLLEGLKASKDDIIVNTPLENSLPNTLNVTFPRVNNAMFMAMLDYHGISVSAGSACNTNDDAPSHVLKAIGLSDEETRQSIRFSLSDRTSSTDIKYSVRVISDYFSGKQQPIGIMTPAQLNEDFILDGNTYILDVRFWHDRKMLKGLPNSHEASFIGFRKYVSRVPRGKNVLVVCQMGYNSPVIAYYLRKRHYRNVSFLLTGLIGWKLANAELYRKLAGKNISKLEPER
jgi:cysteine desulfurase